MEQQPVEIDVSGNFRDDVVRPRYAPISAKTATQRIKKARAHLDLPARLNDVQRRQVIAHLDCQHNGASDHTDPIENAAPAASGEAGSEPETVETAESGEVLNISVCEGPISNTVMQEWSPSWSKFKEALRTPTVGPKNAGQYLLRGVCLPERDGENLSLANLVTLDADSTFDPDTGEVVEDKNPETGKTFAPDFSLTAKTMGALGFDYVAATSATHREGFPRYRIFLQPSRPFTKEEAEPLHSYLHHLLVEKGLRLAYATESHRWSQAWFFPRVEVEGGAFEYAASEGGSALDVEAALQWYAENFQPVDSKSIGAADTSYSKQSSPTDLMGAGPIAWYLREHSNPLPLLLEAGFELKRSGDLMRLNHPNDNAPAGVMLYLGQDDGRWLLYSHHAGVEPFGDAQAHDAFDVFTALQHDSDKKAASTAVLKMQYRPKVEAALDEANMDYSEEQVEVLVEACAASKTAYGLKRDQWASVLGKGKKGTLDTFRESVRGSESSGKSGGGRPDGEEGEGDGRPIEIEVMNTLDVKYKAVYFHDSDKEAYCRFWKNDHFEVWPINSKSFGDLVQLIAYTDVGEAISKERQNSVVMMLRAKAQFEGEQRKLERRVAHRDGTYFVDLGDELWQVLRVTPGQGYELARSDEGPLFVRSRNAQALPMPEAGGDIEELWDYVNIAVADRIMFLVWLLDAFREDTQYPVLFLKATSGTGKTETAKLIRQTIDNNKALTNMEPKSIRDAIAVAKNNHVLLFDNVSRIPSAISDLFCCLSTGTGYSARTLFTDSDESALFLKRPIVIDSIEFVIRREDLVDRLVFLELPELPKETRKSERMLERERRDALPRILGALLELFCQAVEIADDMEVTANVRMQDYAKLGLAVQRVLGEQENFDVDLFERQEELRHKVLSDSPFMGVFLDRLHRAYEQCKKEGDLWQAKEWFSVTPDLEYDDAMYVITYPGKLLEAMERTASQERIRTAEWVKHGSGLLGALDRNKKVLHRIGLTWRKWKTTNQGVLYEFRYKPEEEG
jgi:hypothetical protein